MTYDAEREKYRVVITNGIVFTPDGHVQPDTHNDHDSQQNYVMDEFGNFYLFDERTFKRVRHSRIFSGAR